MSACNACRAELRTIAFHAAGYPIFRCSTCGLGTASVADFDANQYYTRDYFQGGHADGYGDYEGSADTLREEFTGAVRALSRQGFDSGKLLEVGCAYGYFLDVAKSHFDVRGIEISDDAATAARGRGHRVETGTVTASNAGQDNDVVVLLDVIEHVPDPNEVVAVLAKSLRAGGALMLTTGDFGSPMSRLMGKRWRLMTPPQHLFFFTKDALDRMFARHGLTVVSVEYPWKRVPLSLITHQLQRALGRANPTPVPLKLGVPVNLFDAFRVVAKKR